MDELEHWHSPPERRPWNLAAAALELVPLLGVVPVAVANELDNDSFGWIGVPFLLASGLGWWSIRRGEQALGLALGRFFLGGAALVVMSFSGGEAFRCFEAGPRCEDDGGAQALFFGALLVLVVTVFVMPTVSAIMVARASRIR